MPGPLDALRRAVTGRVEAGEATPIVEQRATRRVAIALEIEIPVDVDVFAITVAELDMIDAGLLQVGADNQAVDLVVTRYEVHPDPSAVFADD